MNGRSSFPQSLVLLFILALCLSAAAEEKRENVGEPVQNATSNKQPVHDYWAIENAAEREKLPLYKTIPAARPEELTPANGCPKAETFLTWHRSHGDNGGMR